MVSFNRFRKLFQKIQVIRPPRHRLSTFGASSINYLLVTDVAGYPDRARLRVGKVTAEKPALITPESLKERFEGFGQETQDYVRWLTTHYGEALRGLDYQFRNVPSTSKVELVTPEFLAEKIAKELDQSGESRQALIHGVDKFWELSIMKFILEETMASFSVNVQELQERGMFDGEQRTLNLRKREIENLFRRATADKTNVPLLGQKLKEYNLFETYQDRFFQLLNT